MRSALTICVRYCAHVSLVLFRDWVLEGQVFQSEDTNVVIALAKTLFAATEDPKEITSFENKLLYY